MKHIPIIPTTFAYVMDVNSRNECYISARHFLNDPSYYAWIKSRHPRVKGILGTDTKLSCNELMLAY